MLKKRFEIVETRELCERSSILRVILNIYFYEIRRRLDAHVKTICRYIQCV